MKQKVSGDGRPITSDGKSQLTQLVVLVLRGDGSAQSVAFEREEPLPHDFTLNGSVRKKSMDFPTLPKRMHFFFSKFKDNQTSADEGGADEKGGEDEQ
jgi:hypothetical protein